LDLRDPQARRSRVDHPDVGPPAPVAYAVQRAVLPGHAHHVAEAVKIQAGLVGERDAVVDAAHRESTADGQPGPVDDRLRFSGQEVVSRTVRSSAL